MIGQTLDGKYQLVRLLGEGGMGAVYEAQHTGTGRRVAVKVILGDLGKHQSLVTRFQREAKAAGSIDTQHIAQVLDTGTDAESEAPFMVMGFLSGEDVQQLFRRISPLRPDFALRIAAQACLGLQKAHDARVVHRDIKPANLFLAERDGGEIVIKILDFGIAKIKQDQAGSAETAGLTRTGSMLGSPLYMSPEQARGAKSIDHRADLWSLGVVLYQALTGRTPHEDIEALGELIIAICSEPPRPVQELAPWVSPEVAAIAHRALRFDPADRFQSAGEMLDAIKPLLPNGWALHQDMVTAMNDDDRAVVAEKLALTDQTPPVRPSVVVNATSAPGVASSPDLGEAPTSIVPPPGPVSSTDPGAPRSSATSAASATWPAPARRSPVLLVALGVAIAGASIGAYELASSKQAPAPASSVVAAATPSVVPTAESAPTTTPSAPPAQDHTVKLVLMPPDTSAEVDGAAATAKDGIIEIVGTLGSVHKVRLFKGKRETFGDVVVTESGAIPPKLELEAAPHPGSSKPKGAATPATATATPAPKPTGAGVDKRFE